MPSAFASESIEPSQRRPPNPKPIPPPIGTGTGPTTPLPYRGRPCRRSSAALGNGLFTKFVDVGVGDRFHRVDHRLHRSTFCALATSAIVVLPSLNFLRRSFGRQVERLGRRVEHVLVRRRSPARRKPRRMCGPAVVAGVPIRRRGRRRRASSTRPTARESPITAPATPPTVTAATTTPAATMRRPIMPASPFDRLDPLPRQDRRPAWQKPGISRESLVRRLAPELLSDSPQRGHRRPTRRFSRG